MTIILFLYAEIFSEILFLQLLQGCIQNSDGTAEGDLRKHNISL